MDYVGNLSLRDGLSQYEKQMRAGWLPMTKEDLARTAGLVIGDDTICDIDAVRSYIRRGTILYILRFVLACLTGLVGGVLLAQLYDIIKSYILSCL